MFLNRRSYNLHNHISKLPDHMDEISLWKQWQHMFEKKIMDMFSAFCTRNKNSPIQRHRNNSILRMVWN